MPIMKYCPHCGRRFAAKSKLCQDCGRDYAGFSVVSNLPKKFWMAFGGTVGVLLLSLFSWISAPVKSYGFTLNFNLMFDALSDFQLKWLYYHLAGSQGYAAMTTLMAALWIALLASFAFMIGSLVLAWINYKSKLRAALANIGFGLAALTSLLFMLSMIFLNGGAAGSGVTLFPVLTLALSIVAMAAFVEVFYSMDKQEAREAKLFLIPAYLGLIFITYLPLLAVFAISLFNMRAIGKTSFIGFDNYKFLFTEHFTFLTSIRVTLIYGFLTVMISMFYSMVIALLLNRKIPGRAALRTIFYLPYVIPAVATFLSWQLLYSEWGVINSLIARLGGQRINILFNDRTIIPALAIIAMWSCGNLIVIKMAGLGNVPRVYQEAAEIDGANAWQRFWRITIPCMTPIIFYNMLMSLVSNMQIFVPSLIMSQGGGSGSSSVFDSYQFMTYNMYFEGFKQGIIGRASAISFIFFILVGIFTVILFITSKKWLFYEGGDPK